MKVFVDMWNVNCRETRVNDSHTCHVHMQTTSTYVAKKSTIWFDFLTKGSSFAFSATLKQETVAFSFASLLVWTIWLIINKTMLVSTETFFMLPLAQFEFQNFKIFEIKIKSNLIFLCACHFFIVCFRKGQFGAVFFVMISIC